MEDKKNTTEKEISAPASGQVSLLESSPNLEPEHQELPTAQALDLFDLEDEFLDEEDNPSELLEAVRIRCDAANMKYELSIDPLDAWMRIDFPAGRETRPVFIRNSSTARTLLGKPFEGISFVGDFEAICHYQEKYIIAALGSLGPGNAMARFRQLFGIYSYRELREKQGTTIEIIPPSDHPNISVTLSLELDGIFDFSRHFGGIPKPVLSIRNIEISTNTRAVELLETISNSLLFEIDLRFSIPLTLVRHRRLIGGVVGRSFGLDKLNEKPLQFPSNSYDRRAIALYWYGRSAAGMPLLRFLAFYQSVEFYFPTYSQNEAIRQIKRMLKDPRFNIHDDADLAHLVHNIQTSRNGSVGDERSQLRAVINSCVDSAALRTFLERKSLRDFYTDAKHRWKQISKIKIPLNDEGSDLRNVIAERMYDIRNRIVHAKSDNQHNDNDVLLPFSKEADQLSADTEVIQFISTQTLIASSNQFSL